MPRKNKILIRNGTTVPAAIDFDLGEPAWQTSGVLYVKNASGVMTDIAQTRAHKTQHVSGGSDAITAAEINALPTAGGTMTGVIAHASTQTFVSALGSQGSPSHTFTGDPDTGVFSHGADQVALATNGASRLYVSSIGRVGIGTISPGSNLDIQGTGNVLARVYDTGGGNATLNLNSGANTGQIAMSGTTLFVTNYTTAASFLIQQAGDGNIRLLTNNSDRLYINGSGLVGVGVTPATGKGILQLAGGIGFPATAVLSTDANTLDDYEIGSWTPSLSAATTAPTVTYNADALSGRVGRYVKVGGVVHIWGRIRLASKSGGSGGVIITGLPFAVKADAVNSPSIYVGYRAGWTTNGPDGGFFAQDSTHISLVFNTATTSSNLPNANMGAASDIMWSGFYETDS